ncbi:MAG: PilT/PilU family type 4a pilus ATPase [Gammaproteobacteria bacterium]
MSKSGMQLKSYFPLMREQRASDLYISANARVKIRVDGRIRSVGREVVSAADVDAAALDLMNEYQRQKYQDEQQVEFAIDEAQNGRFRFSVFRQRGMTAVTIRYIPVEIPALDTLNMPKIISTLARLRRGLVLVVGATGAGKSTTLAAMLELRNRQNAEHIITIEDPIEYVHANHQCIVNQRELVTDTPSWALALRGALRAAPDVVMIGEIRDREAMSAVMEIADSGHLAFSTLHTVNASQTLERIVNMFPELMHREVLMDLAANLRAVVSQRLVRGTDEKLLPAVEVMINTPFIADLIQQGRISEIKAAMEDSREPGMQSFETALATLYRRHRISMDEALAHADSRANLKTRLHFS